MTLPHDIDDVTGWGWFFFGGYGLLFTAYVVVQLAALLRLHGAARIWIALPIPFMVWVLYVTFAALAQKEHHWPTILIFASQIALAYLVAVSIVAFIVRRAKRKRAEAIAH